MIDIGIDSTQIARLQRALEGAKQTVAKEVATAINATGKWVASEINKSIRQELIVTKKAVDEVLKVRGKARPDALGVVVVLQKAARLPLRDFGAKQVAKGVSYKISKQAGRKLAMHAFAVDKWRGRVFKRIRKSRLPITQLHGPSPWGVFVKNNHEARIVRQGVEQLYKQVERRIRFRELQSTGKI